MEMKASSLWECQTIISHRRTMLGAHFKPYLDSGKFRFHNITDTDFMMHRAYDYSKFAFW